MFSVVVFRLKRCYYLVFNYLIRYMTSEISEKIERLGKIEGFNGKSNEVIYHPPRLVTSNLCPRVVYFGGDVQDYPENMLSHRDNKRYLQWNLEQTTELLSQKFPKHQIFTIRPVKMHLKTFSCFDNFVPGDDVGSPDFQSNLDCLFHLNSLLKNAQNVIKNKINFSNNLTLLGFSKGCIVLNQVLYSLAFLKGTSQPEELTELLSGLKAIYWLDGGHSGGSKTWVTDQDVLKLFSCSGIKSFIRVTPYQMNREARPWVGKEEKKFRESLKHLEAFVDRKIYFQDKEASLDNHFEILKAFDVD